MKSKWACLGALFFFAVAVSGQYRDALPGYRYLFPRDYFSHPDFQTEWWYYTGNVKSADGHRFGFELTFFREGVDRTSKNEAPWDVRDLYLAHLALSDLDGGTFLHAERMNRAGPGIAGISETDGRIRNGNWQVEWQGDDQTLRAVDQRFAFRFSLRSTKPPVIHGENGVSQKAAGPGRASHYISLTRLNAAGEIQVAGKTFEVTGSTWMDHEFFTHQLEADQVGWDWMSIQLQDNTELMLFRIHRKDGSIDPHSAGTFIDSRGATVHLRADEFVMEPAGTPWISPSTHAAYPVLWKVSVPKLGLTFDCSTPLPSQELVSSSVFVPPYWEGSVAFSGKKNRSRIAGVGYLEMTGYDHPIEALR
jgi:predicted secreted hydrolase